MIVPKHKHIIVRAEVEKPITNTTEIRVWVTDLVEKLGMQLAIVDQGYNPVVAYIDDKGNRGLTAVAVIKTSHIACHIWDELIPALVQLDVYTCSTLEKETVLEHLEVMKPLKVDYKVFDREYKLDEKVEEEGVRRGRETAEYLKSLGYMGGKKDKENADI
jgi:S-adenosylmethionine/arginine decarboxylase-like enzyme